MNPNLLYLLGKQFTPNFVNISDYSIIIVKIQSTRCHYIVNIQS